MITIAYGNVLVLFMLLMGAVVGIMGWQARDSLLETYNSAVQLVFDNNTNDSENLPEIEGQVAGVRTNLAAEDIVARFPVVEISTDSRNPFE